MPLVLIGSIGGILVGTFILLMGILSIGYNKPAAEQYAQTWGRTLKNGYAVGRFISIGGGVLLLLLGLLFIFVPRN
jgi:uncharacterized membrane protein HdeD (DUF308 family)